MTINIGGGISIGAGIGFGTGAAPAGAVITSSYQVAAFNFNSTGYPTASISLINGDTQVVSGDGSTIYLGGYTPGASNDQGQQTAVKLTTTYGSAAAEWAVVQPTLAAISTWFSGPSAITMGIDSNLWLTTGPAWPDGATPTQTGYLAKYWGANGVIASSTTFYTAPSGFSPTSVYQKSNGNLVIGGSTGALKNSLLEMSTSSGYSTVSAKRWIRSSVDFNYVSGFSAVGDAISTGNYAGGSTYFSTLTTVNPTADKTPLGSQAAVGMFTAADTLSWAATLSNSLGCTIYNGRSQVTTTSGTVYVATQAYNVSYTHSYLSLLNNTGIVWQQKFSVASESFQLAKFALDGLGNMICQAARSAGGLRIFSVKLSDRTINWERTLTMTTYGTAGFPNQSLATSKTGVNSSSFFTLSGTMTLSGTNARNAWQLILPSDGSIPNNGTITVASLTFSYVASTDVVSASTTDLTYASDTSNYSSTDVATITYGTPTTGTPATFASRANTGTVTLSNLN